MTTRQAPRKKAGPIIVYPQGYPSLLAQPLQDNHGAVVVIHACRRTLIELLGTEYSVGRDNRHYYSAVIVRVLYRWPFIVPYIFLRKLYSTDSGGCGGTL